MKDITYKITFFSEWHCGSGLTSGSDLDALVIKDGDGLPFIPGKTLKGLLKEAATDILELQGKNLGDESVITDFFGFFDGKPVENSKIHTKGKAFFSNATVSAKLRKKCIGDKSQNEELKTGSIVDFFYRDAASTEIDENGTAKKHSLRRMETVIPCQLSATIYGVDDKYFPELKKCMQWIKRMGQNRNRGMGRCRFVIIEEKEAGL